MSFSLPLLKLKPVWRTAAAAGTVLALLSGLSFAAAPEGDAQLAAIRAELEKANMQTARVLSELKALDIRMGEVTRRVKREETEIASIQSGIRNSEKQSRELDARLEKAKMARNNRASRIYKDGPASIMAALFAVRALADLPKFSIFWRSVADEDARVSAELAGVMQKLAAEKANLAASSKAAAERTQQLEQMKEALKTDRSRRTASLGKLRQSIVGAMRAEKALLQARAAAEAAAKAAAQAAAQKAPSQVRPSPGPCSPGNPTKDRRLAALLAWYAPAAGSEPFMPPKLGSTDVVFDGVTSWYGPGFEGCATASGATFNSAQMTAASLSLPLGTLLKVTRGGKSVVVVITDRGPYIPGRDLDLSKGAAAAIGISGVTSVRMEVVLPNEPAPPFP